VARWEKGEPELLPAGLEVGEGAACGGRRGSPRLPLAARWWMVEGAACGGCLRQGRRGGSEVGDAQLKKHRIQSLAPFGNRRTFSATKNVLRFNLSDDGMFLERKSSEFCRIVPSGVRLTFDVRLLQQRTLTAFFVLQLAVDEASSNPPFHPLLVLSFDASCFWLCGVCVCVCGL